MARGVVVQLGAEESSFAIKKVDREKLYGRKERLVVDENEKPCSSAWLTGDGVALVPSGGMSYSYVDENFDTIDRSALRAVDNDNNPLIPVPSTLGVAQKLVGPVAPDRILDFVVISVYELTAESLGESLRDSLARGDVYETIFNYREDYHAESLFLLQNDQGVFALIANPTNFDFVNKDQVSTDASTEEEEETDDLDFSMM